MDRHYTTLAQITSPVLVGVLVVYPVLYIVWQEIFKLDRCTKLEIDLGIFPAIL